MRMLQAAVVEEGAASEDVLQAGLGILRESDLRPFLPGIHQRTLAIHGERDQLTPIAAGTSPQPHYRARRWKRSKALHTRRS